MAGTGSAVFAAPLAAPADGKRLFDYFLAQARRRHPKVECGQFGHPAADIGAVGVELPALEDGVEDAEPGLGIGAQTGGPLPAPAVVGHFTVDQVADEMPLPDAVAALIRDGEAWLIDFQGLRQGCAFYDFASLAFDPYLTRPDMDLWRIEIEDHAREVSEWKGSADEFTHLLHVAAADPLHLLEQRHRLARMALARQLVRQAREDRQREHLPAGSTVFSARLGA